MANETNGDSQPHLTPTERRIMDMLSDGRPHSILELQKCLWDELAVPSSVSAHLCRLRKKLVPMREIRVVTRGRTYWYILVAGSPAWTGPIP